jgi:MFS family permease
MGMRSATDSLNLLWLAAAAQGLEAAGLVVVAAVNVSDLAGGQTYQTSNAVAVIVIEVIVAVGVAAIAAGIVRVRPWSRTPAVMTQVFTFIIGIVLIQAHRFGWGLPALVFAIAGLVGLFAPTSLRKLNHPPRATPQ